MAYADLPARFHEKVKVDPSGCWVWTAAKDSGGYGRYKLNGRMQYAHRVAFEAERGPIPEGMHLDHLCFNRACTRPDHLEPVTSRESTLRGEGHAARNARKTHCPRGHELTADNNDAWAAARGMRKCLTCHRDRTALHNAVASALAKSWGVPWETAFRDDRVKAIVRDAWALAPSTDAEGAELVETLWQAVRIERPAA